MRKIVFRALCPKCKGSPRQQYYREELRVLLNQGQRQLTYRCPCGDGGNEHFYWIPDPEQIEHTKRFANPN